MHNGRTFPYRPRAAITEGATEKDMRAGFLTSP